MKPPGNTFLTLMQVAAGCQRSIERANCEIQLYQVWFCFIQMLKCLCKEHLAKMTKILKKKDVEISTLTGDNEKLTGTLTPYRT